MKRPHRRLHLLMWLIIAPVTAIAGYLLWSARPDTPLSEIPAAADTTPDGTETQ